MEKLQVSKDEYVSLRSVSFWAEQLTKPNVSDFIREKQVLALKQQLEKLKKLDYELDERVRKY